MIRRIPERSQKHIMPAVFLSFFLMSFHAYLILYINSTFLEKYISPEHIGYLFSIGAFITLLILFSAPQIIRKFGAFKLTIALFLIEFIAVGFIGFVTITPAIIILFVTYRGVVGTLMYILDLYLESASKKEENTGKIRGLYFTLSNATLIVSPAIAGLIANETNFERVYILSSLFIIPVLFIITRNLRGEAKNIEAPRNMLQAVPVALKDRNLRNILVARTLLQFFYVIMVVYVPVYLLDSLGFSWKQIGFMLTFMLLPFALFQFPAGYLADKKFGEKELLILGFIFVATFTLIFALIGKPIFVLLAIILFMTRVGASVVEIMTESYFFKHVDEDNGGLISMFRATSPFAYLVSPLLGSLALSFLGFEAMFGILGLLMYTGIFFALRIKDTK